VVVSLYVTVDMCRSGECEGYDTDVTVGMCTYGWGSVTRRVVFYVSLGGGGLRPSGSSSG